MPSSTETFRLATKEEAEAETNPELYQHYESLVTSLPSSNGLSYLPLSRHEHGWYGSQVSVVGAMVADACFTARSSDIIVATPPKAGTTWMKALLYAIVHRRKHPVDAADHPFNSLSPHECIKFLELQLYTHNRIPGLDKVPGPRLFATHVPFMSLPRTVMSSGSKIVYVWRDPKDTLVSMWHFVNKINVYKGQEPVGVETAVDLFCRGLSLFGPYWDHVLGYRHAHLTHPHQVLLFKYEEMQRDPAAHVRMLAEFVGCSFSAEEEGHGVVDGIVKLCDFERMSGLEATTGGKFELGPHIAEKSFFFRRGEVGDWVNHLSPEAARRIDEITEAKFQGL